MSAILQLSRTLQQRPIVPDMPGLRLRNYLGEQDIPLWLDLRHRAFARQKMGVRQWGEADFAAEFLAKWWWRAERMWFAEAPKLLSNDWQPVGAVCLAMRGDDDANAKPVVHWLAVLPNWRRRGAAKLLMAALERHAYDAGRRRLWLETHAEWREAVALYRRLGWEDARDNGTDGPGRQGEV